MQADVIAPVHQVLLLIFILLLIFFLIVIFLLILLFFRERSRLGRAGAGRALGEPGNHLDAAVGAIAAWRRRGQPIPAPTNRGWLADVFAFEPGPASWKHAPTTECCSRQEPLG